MMDYDRMREAVARAICESGGIHDPNDGWGRFGDQAAAAIRAMHEFLKAEKGWDKCEECGVGRDLEKILACRPRGE